MAYGLKLLTPPVADPVSVEKAKRRLRIDGPDEEADLADMIAECTATAEAECGRAFMLQRLALYLDEFPCGADLAIRLPRPPLIAVESVRYVDGAGDWQTLAASAYAVSTGEEPGRIVPAAGETWPATFDQPGAVEVIYSAGYGATAADLPAVVRGAVYAILEHRWMNRGDEAKAGIPATARRMLDSLEFGGL